MVSNIRSEIPVKNSVISKKKKSKLKSSKSLSKNIKLNAVDKITINKAIEDNSTLVNDQDTVQLSPSTAELGERFPVLKDEELVKKFLGVSMTNNQKGRVRQQLKDQLKDTTQVLLPDVIHNRIQGVIKNSTNLTDAELRKIRILYNMLKTAVKDEKNITKSKKHKKRKEKKIDKENTTDVDKTKEGQNEMDNGEVEVKEKEKKVAKEHKQKSVKKDANEEQIQKPKGPKRYVVFVGNLPVDVNKDIIMNHFWEMNENIVSVRIPKRDEGNKSCIAYVELGNEASYELALSKHHSMLGTKRINVLYTTQKKTKISKTEAKSKSAKLIALQKSGQLAGSIAMNKKRSHRRMKAKQAQAKLAEAQK